MASRELLPLSPSDGRIVDLGASGRGVVATRNLEPGEVLFKEYPLIAMQHGSSRAAGCLNCVQKAALDRGSRRLISLRRCEELDFPVLPVFVLMHWFRITTHLGPPWNDRGLSGSSGEVPTWLEA